MKRIESATPEQWEDMYKIRDSMLAAQTQQYSDEEILEAFHNCLNYLDGDYSKYKAVIVDGPKAAKALIGDAESVPFLSFWRAARLAVFGAGIYLGAELDMEKYKIYSDWTLKCGHIIISGDTFYILRNPVEIHWDGELLHNDSGPVVLYADGWAHYALEGHPVDHQLVMEPETQTIEQVLGEQNEEVRRIRIERYGLLGFLEQSDSKVLEYRRNDVEATVEMLVQTTFGKNLVTFCPSTGRRYFLSIPDQSVKTCVEAQMSIWGNPIVDGKPVRIIGRT